MEILDLVQGSPEWHAHRLTHFNASDAAAMMGESPYESRQSLIKRLATGIAPEITPQMQALFDEGHRTEALARSLAEEIIGSDLYPIVGTNGKLSASFDGMPLDLDQAFEHKMLNDVLREAMPPQSEADPDDVDFLTAANLPMLYQIQMEHQCIVAAIDKVLFMASKWEGDELVEERHCWYRSNPELAERIRLGWEQLERDVCAYVPQEVVEAPKVEPVKALPALVVKVEGRVVSTNLDAFQAEAGKYLEAINTKLESDEDFARAELDIKACDETENRLQMALDQAMAQTQSLDQLFRAVNHIKEQFRAKRLGLEKSVKTQKDSIRERIVLEHQAQLDEHIAELNKRLEKPWLAPVRGGFAEAMKGKRTVATLRAAAHEELNRCKLDATRAFKSLNANRDALWRDGADWLFLFADFATVGQKQAEDFAAIADKRIRDHQDAEAKRQDEQDAKAAAAAAPVAAAQPAPAPQPVTAAAATLPPAAAANEATWITLSVLNERLGKGLSVTADFLTGLGFAHRAERASKLYDERLFPDIVRALITHLESRIEQRKAA